MNLFYEEYPVFIRVEGEIIPIHTDFRKYIKLMDILKSEDASDSEKAEFICSFFLKMPSDINKAIGRFLDFVLMKDLKLPAREGTENGEEGSGMESEKPVKALYSFEYDYPFILSGFLQCYQINLKTIDYMHWWEFRCLFQGLPDDTGIKQRIQYRNYDLSSIKDKAERRRIRRIQNEIRLPSEQMSDYEIGNAFM